MAENSKLNDMNKTNLDSIRTMLDANTIVGEPINTSGGVVIIPISKITVGYASGGIDYQKKTQQNANGKPAGNNFGGGGGTGLTVQPVGFLVVQPDGNVSMLNVNTPCGGGGATDPVSSVVGLIEKSPDLVERFREIFGKKDPSSDC